MKTSLATFILTASLLPALGFSAPQGEQTPAAQGEQSVVDIQQFDKQKAQAQENLQKMQEYMSRIQKTQDPQERQRLLEQHQTMMQESMGMMNQMWGNSMGCCMGGNMTGRQQMNGGMRGGHMMGWNQMHGQYSSLTPQQMQQRQYMMEQYMGMQQQMMEQMMLHQHHMGMQPR